MFDADSAPADVRSIETALRALCSALDPDDVPLPEASGLWEGLDAIERLAGGAKCRLARRVEQSQAWRRRGDRSAADWMARTSGATTGRARADLETSKQLASLPGTDRAVAEGKLSDPQAVAVADAASADPEAESRLLGTAERAGLRDLRDECGRTKARTEDEQTRATRLHRQRSMRTWKGADGSWNLQMANTPEVGAQIEAVLAPVRDRIFHDARIEGRHEANEPYAADALTEVILDGTVVPAAADATPADIDAPVAPSSEEISSPVANRAARRRARSRRPDTKVIALIDYEALKRGAAEPGETCEIAGVGPVAVSTVRSLLGDAFGAAVVTNGVDVFNVAHLGRSASAAQRTALEARGYRCEVPGCDANLGLEIDHIEDWNMTHRTSLDCLCWLCRRHHLDKTHRGWRLQGPPGNRIWVPPPGGASPPGPDPPGAGERLLFDAVAG